MRVMRRDLLFVEKSACTSRPKKRSRHIVAEKHKSQLAPCEVEHPPQPPAASAPLDSASDSTASLPSNTLATHAASEESGEWPEWLWAMVSDSDSEATFFKDDVPRKTRKVKRPANNHLLQKLNKFDMCKKDTGRCLRSLFSTEVYPATTVSHLAARMRGLTRTLGCSLAMHSRQTTYVALCIFEVHTPSVQRGINRELPPPHPVLKPSHCRTIGSRSSTTTKLKTSSSATASGEKSAATTMDAGPSNSFHLAGAPATTSMALRWGTPPRKRRLARTYCRYAVSYTHLTLPTKRIV